MAFEVLYDDAPPEVQRAFYEALRNLPAVRNEGTVRDASGRDVLAISARTVSFLLADTKAASS